MARIFPLKVKVDSYKSNYSCRFVAPRNDGRKHGGVDLAANVGADVFAVGDGVVVEAAGGFDKYGTSVISIKHGDFYDDDYCIVRYGEIGPPMKRVGDFVEMGELIAKVGKQPGPGKARWHRVGPIPSAGQSAVQTPRQHRRPDAVHGFMAAKIERTRTPTRIQRHPRGWRISS